MTADIVATILLYFLFFVFLGLKFFKILCYSVLALEWLPVLNPFLWPYCLLYEITEPYFQFWSKLLPALRINKATFDISTLVGLEVLNFFIYIYMKTLTVFLIYFNILSPT
jgi:uncharacterized protein YggT (Ycf19 family)